MYLLISFFFLCAALSLLGALIWHQFSWNKGFCRRCGARLKIFPFYAVLRNAEQHKYHNAECPKCSARYFVLRELLENRYSVLEVVFLISLCLFVSFILYWSYTV